MQNPDLSVPSKVSETRHAGKQLANSSHETAIRVQNQGLSQGFASLAGQIYRGQTCLKCQTIPTHRFLKDLNSTFCGFTFAILVHLNSTALVGLGKISKQMTISIHPTPTMMTDKGCSHANKFKTVKVKVEPCLQILKPLVCPLQ